MTEWSSAGAVAWKDTRAELASGERLATMTALAIALLAAFRVAFFLLGDDRLGAAGPAVLWSTLFLAGLFGLAASFGREREGRAIEGLLLAPGDRFAIYLGKLAAALPVQWLVAVVTLFLFVAFFRETAVPWALAPILLVGTSAYAAAGVVASALTLRARSRELVFPTLLIALAFFTTIVPSLTATAKAMAGDPTWTSDLAVTAAAALAYLAVAYLTFEDLVVE